MTDLEQRRFRGCTKIGEYEVMNEKLGEGTFGVVSKAQSRRTGEIVALKKILMHNEKEGFPITALREVKLLKMLSHPNILHLEEMAVERQQVDEKGKSGKKRATLYMVMPYMDHDLSGMLTNPDIRFSDAQIKCYMLQLFEGLRYLHASHILHRDMKAANILISNRGVLQIADFGLARHYEGHTPQPGHGNGEAVRDYTSLVVTRWYRPPELLLTLKRYTPAIDMWGVGCIFGEMFERKPILEGRSDIDQCVRIFKLIGSPTEETMPGWSELPGCEGRKEWEASQGDIGQRFGRIGSEGLNLLKRLLCLDWRKRINAVDALRHEYFQITPLPARPDELPRYEDSHELDSRRRGNQEKQRALPPAPAGGTVGMGPEEWNGAGPVNGNHPNGYGYGDRPPRGYARDRAAPPPRGYEDRRAPPPPVPDGGGRQPAWRQDRRPAPANGHSGPPRSELPARPSQGAGVGAGARSGVDTYIPAYGEERAPAHRDRDAYDRPRRRSRDNTYREPAAQPRPRDHDAPAPPRTYRDPDAPDARPEPRGDRYRDRDRDRGDGYGARDDPRRTRSRSPDWERRERLQNRERDFYRR